MGIIKDLLLKKVNIAIIVSAVVLVAVGIYCFATLDNAGAKSEVPPLGAAGEFSAEAEAQPGADADAAQEDVSAHTGAVADIPASASDLPKAETGDPGGSPAKQTEQTEDKQPAAAAKDKTDKSKPQATSQGSTQGSGSTGAASPEASDPAAVTPPASSDASKPDVGKPEAGKEEKPTESDKLTATLAIDCLTILDHMDDLAKGKAPYVGDGIIMSKRTVEFTEGETVFDVLFRECKQSGIHMSSKFTPIYDSAYIEGINQLYEFDCGSLSGWMYKVNGIYPNYGCSQYTLKQGDVIEWRYTTDLGKDIGGSTAVG